MASNFSTPVDIGNRALQRVGAKRITAFTDLTKNAKEVAFCYDKLRRAELRRNVWRFAVRRTILRPVGTSLQPWVSTTAYAIGALVGENGTNYIALTLNTGNDPSTDNGTNWIKYYGTGTLSLTFPVWAIGTTYNAYAIVKGSDTGLYMSLSTSTGIDPTTDLTGTWVRYYGNIVASQFDSTSEYSVGEIVFSASDATLVYYNTINGNNNDPSTSIGWVALTCTAKALVVLWPAGTGPATELQSKNVYVLPYGFLRRAPPDPSAGRTSFMGFPSNLPVDDWVPEGNYIVTMLSTPMMIRYVADIQDVTQMDDLFCEGLGSRVALEVCEPLTQSTAKLQAISSEYKAFMGDARNVNGIEEGSQPPPLDDLILCRF